MRRFAHRDRVAFDNYDGVGNDEHGALDVDGLTGIGALVGGAGVGAGQFAEAVLAERRWNREVWK